MPSAAAGVSETQRRRSSDPISWYLATIGRIPLLTPAEEIELGKTFLREHGTAAYCRVIFNCNEFIHVR